MPSGVYERAPTAERMLMQYKRNAMAAHDMKHYAMRDKWCQKHDALALMLIAGDDPFERKAA